MTLTDRQIFCAAPKYSYNDPSKGLAYEFITVFKSLQDAFPSACFVDVYQPGGMNELTSRISNSSGARPIVLYSIHRDHHPRKREEKSQVSEFGIFIWMTPGASATVQKYSDLCDWFTTSDPQYHWRYGIRRISGQASPLWLR